MSKIYKEPLRRIMGLKGSGIRVLLLGIHMLSLQISSIF